MIVKKNKSIDLSIPKFSVDDYINEELLEFESMNHINKASFNVLIGKSGSGKTSLLVSLLTNTKPKIMKKQYESILIVMPSQSRNSLKNNIFDKHIDEDNLYNNLDVDSMDNIHNKIMSNSEEGLRTLLILDDVASSLKNSYITKMLQKLIYAYRHYKLTIMLLVQTFKTIPPSVRKNITNLIIFKPSMNEWNQITEEFLEIDKNKSIDLFKLAFKNQYNWVLVNLQTGKMYLKFDEIIYND